MEKKIELEIAGSIASITLNRPDVLNALDWQMISELRDSAERVRNDPEIRVLLLRGNGTAFAAGGDVAMFHANLASLPEMIVKGARELHHAILALRRMAKPVIASVHGAVAGGGLSLMMASDLVIAADDTKFTMAYSRIATSPDGGATYFLPRLVGYQKAMELALLSDTLDAPTALTLGLVNWTVPATDLTSATQRLLRRLADGPTQAYAETKALLNQSPHSSLEAQLEAEAQAFARCARTADLKEGVGAFVEKRRPKFVGR